MKTEPLTTIESEADYEAALREAIELADIDPSPDDEVGRRLVALVDMLQLWEMKTCPSWFGLSRIGETPEEINAALDAAEKPV